MGVQAEQSALLDFRSCTTSARAAAPLTPFGVAALNGTGRVVANSDLGERRARLAAISQHARDVAAAELQSLSACDRARGLYPALPFGHLAVALQLGWSLDAAGVSAVATAQATHIGGKSVAT